MAVILFEDDDTGYLRRISEHPDGYVVNMRRWLDPDYLVLHHAGCPSVIRYPNMRENPGGFTERAYRKLCCTSLSELKDHLSQMTSSPDPFSKVRSRCALPADRARGQRL